MKQTQKNILLWVAIIVLIIVTTSWFGALYEMIIGRELSPGFWGPSNPEYVPGFFVATGFSFSFLLTIFLTKNRYKTLAISLVVLVLIELFFELWDLALGSLALALIAWILAQVVLLVRKVIK